MADDNVDVQRWEQHQDPSHEIIWSTSPVKPDHMNGGQQEGPWIENMEDADDDTIDEGPVDIGELDYHHQQEDQAKPVDDWMEEDGEQPDEMPVVDEVEATTTPEPPQLLLVTEWQYLNVPEEQLGGFLGDGEGGSGVWQIVEPSEEDEGDRNTMEFDDALEDGPG